MHAQPAKNLITSALLIFSFTHVQPAHSAVNQHGIDILPLEGRYAVSAAIGHDSPAYHVCMDGNSLTAGNTVQGLSVRFSSAGIKIGAGNKQFSLQPVMWGYGAELALLPEGMPQAVGNMVSSSRGSVSEWYINGPLGLQQGFTVAEKPHIGTGPLKITIAFEGATAGSVDADGKGVMLKKTDGSPLYRYSGLMVRDAVGRQTEAWLESKNDTLTICVNDSNLTYPIYIDPIIQSAKLTASGGSADDRFGSGVAVSGDTVVVGAYWDDVGANTNQGSAYVFVKPENGWTNITQTAKLIASDGGANDGFGISVAIDSDTIVVGAYYADVNHGAAYVFVKPAGGWTDMTQTAKLAASDGAANDYFGFFVAISGDTAVIGAYGDDSGANADQGSAYVFVKPTEGWADMTQTAKLAASDGAANDKFGYAVAIKGDTIVAGALQDSIGANTAQGSAYVFVKPESGWTNITQTAKLTASDGAAGDYFGVSVAIDNDTITVGAFYDDIGSNTDQGSTYVFVKPESGWTNITQTAKLTASDGAASDGFGYKVAVSGSTIVASASSDDNGKGAAYVFVKPEGGWINMTQTAKLTASDGSANDNFGNSVAISGNTIIVAAILSDIGANADQGSAYVFTIYNTTTTTTTEPSTSTTVPTSTTTEPTTTSTIETTTTTSAPSSTTTTVESSTTTTEPPSPTTTSAPSSTTTTVESSSTTTTVEPSSTTTTTTPAETCTVEFFPRKLNKIFSSISPLQAFIIRGDETASFSKATGIDWGTLNVETMIQAAFGKRIIIALVLVNGRSLNVSETYEVTVGDCTGKLPVKMF